MSPGKRVDREAVEMGLGAHLHLRFGWNPSAEEMERFGRLDALVDELESRGLVDGEGEAPDPAKFEQKLREELRRYRGEDAAIATLDTPVSDLFGRRIDEWKSFCATLELRPALRPSRWLRNAIAILTIFGIVAVLGEFLSYGATNSEMPLWARVLVVLAIGLVAMISIHTTVARTALPEKTLRDLVDEKVFDFAWRSPSPMSRAQARSLIRHAMALEMRAHGRRGFRAEEVEDSYPIFA